MAAFSHVKSNTIGDFTGTVTVHNSAGGTQTVAATNLVRPSDWNSVHNGYQTLLGNTDNASTWSGTNLQYSFGAGITGKISGNTLEFSGPQSTLSGRALVPYGGRGGPIPFAQSSASLGQNSLYIYPHMLDHYLTCDHIRMPVFVTNSSSAAASVQKGATFRFGIYTRENSTRLSRLYSTSYTIAASHNSNVSWMLSLVTAIGNSTSYNTLTASSGGINLSASLHGAREFIIPVSSLLTPGEYFFAVMQSTSSAGAGGNVLNISNLAVANQTFNRPGQSTNATNSGFHQYMLYGTYSATTNAFPATINNTQINQLGTMPILFAAMGTV
jgi:hypothetical protein